MKLFNSQGYGLTESTAVATRGFNTKNLHNYTSVGLLAPNMEAKVIDLVTGVMKGPGNIGELLLRGPAIMQGNLSKFYDALNEIKLFMAFQI